MDSNNPKIIEGWSNMRDFVWHQKWLLHAVSVFGKFFILHNYV